MMAKKCKYGSKKEQLQTQWGKEELRHRQTTHKIEEAQSRRTEEEEHLHLYRRSITQESR